MKRIKQYVFVFFIVFSLSTILSSFPAGAKFKSPDKSSNGIDYYIIQTKGKSREVSAKLRNSEKVIQIPETIKINKKVYVVTEITGNCYPDTLDTSASMDAYKCEKNKKTEKVFIPKTIRKIEKGTFTNFKKLKSIAVTEDNPYFKSADGSVLSKNGRILYGVPSIKGTYQVPDGVKEIYSRAFAYSSVKKVILPKSCKVIQSRAFYQCKNLKEIKNLSRINKIGKNAFYGSRIKDIKTR